MSPTMKVAAVSQIAAASEKTHTYEDYRACSLPLDTFLP